MWESEEMDVVLVKPISFRAWVKISLKPVFSSNLFSSPELMPEFRRFLMSSLSLAILFSRYCFSPGGNRRWPSLAVSSRLR